MRLVYVGYAYAAMTHAMPQAVTYEVFPQPNDIPADCATSWQGRFAIQLLNLGQIQKRKVLNSTLSTSFINVESICQGDRALSLALIDSVLRDGQGRIGYIAGNRQFQFDNPPQSGALITAGFSICSNGSLALGSSTTWWACSSGTFSKLYDQNWAAAQCSSVQLKAVQVVNCAEDPAIVTVGSLSPSVSTFLAALANTPVDLPSRTWALATDYLTPFASVTTNTPASSNSTLSNPTSATHLGL